MDKEVNNLRASSQQMSELQIQHEKNLQQQYKLLDKKTTDIHSLERLVSTLQAERAHLAAELKQQRSLALQSEALANELVAVAKERDLLEDSLRECKDALEKLQKIIEEHGMERKVLESMREIEYAELQAEVSVVTLQLRSKESEVVQVLGQLGEKSEQNEKLTADLLAAHAALVASESTTEEMKRVVSKNEAQMTLRDREIAELETKCNLALSDYLLIKGQFDEATNHISELQRELKVANDQSQRLVDRNQSLTEQLIVMQDERNTAVANIVDSNARCQDFETKYASALEVFEEKIQSLKQEYEEDISKLKTSGDELRKEVARLEESEEIHAQALQEVEKNALEEARRHQVKAAKLDAECDLVRKEMARLQDLEVEQSRSIKALVESDKHGSVETDNSVKIAELRGEVEHFQTLQESAVSNLEALQSTIAETSRAKEAEIAHWIDQSEQLRTEVSRLQEVESEKRCELEVLVEKMKETSYFFETEVAGLKAEIAQLQAQAEHHRDVEEKRAERDQLGKVTQERDILSEENEDMLVQIGLMKQQTDQAEEQARALQAEIEAIRGFAGDEAVHVELEKLRATNTNLDARLHAAAVERECLSSKALELEATASELPEIRSRNLELTERIQLVESDRDAFRARIQQLETSLTEEQTYRASVESMIENLKSHSASLAQQLLEKQNKIDSLQEDLNETVATEEFDIKVAAMEDECIELKKALADKENEVKFLEEKVDNAVDSSDSMIQELKNLRKILKEKEEDHANLVEDLEKKITSLNGQLEYSIERMKSVEAALEVKEHIVMLLKESEIQIAELESEVKESNEKVAKLEMAVDEKDRLLSEATATSPAVENDLKALQKEIDVLEEILQSTRGRLAAKEEQMDDLAVRMRELQEGRLDEATRAVTEAIEIVSGEAERLRETLIGKAIKLKRSDSIRAEALQRIQEERRANAERIRLLNESVERYYGSPTK